MANYFFPQYPVHRKVRSRLQFLHGIQHRRRVQIGLRPCRQPQPQLHLCPILLTGQALDLGADLRLHQLLAL